MCHFNHYLNQDTFEYYIVLASEISKIYDNNMTRKLKYSNTLIIMENSN